MIEIDMVSRCVKDVVSGLGTRCFVEVQWQPVLLRKERYRDRDRDRQRARDRAWDSTVKSSALVSYKLTGFVAG